MPEEEVSPYPLATEPDEEAEEEFDDEDIGADDDK
jgi:hypothetical protein